MNKPFQIEMVIHTFFTSQPGADFRGGGGEVAGGGPFLFSLEIDPLSTQRVPLLYYFETSIFGVGALKFWCRSLRSNSAKQILSKISHNGDCWIMFPLDERKWSLSLFPPLVSCNELPPLWFKKFYNFTCAILYLVTIILLFAKGGK